MATKREAVKVETTVGDAVNTAFCGIEELAAEMREWFDNMPENLQGSGKGEEVEAAADELEGIYEPDIDEGVDTLPVVFMASPQRVLPFNAPPEVDAAALQKMRAMREETMKALAEVKTYGPPDSGFTINLNGWVLVIPYDKMAGVYNALKVVFG